MAQSFFLFFGRCCQPIAKQTRRVKMAPIVEKHMLMLFLSIRKQKTRARKIRIWVHPIYGIGVIKVLFNISFDGMYCIVKNLRLGSWYIVSCTHDARLHNFLIIYTDITKRCFLYLVVMVLNDPSKYLD